jgi:U32 family peptidase
MPLDRIPKAVFQRLRGRSGWPAAALALSWLRGTRVSAVEEKIGVVTDYLNRVGVAVVRITDGDLRLGDRVKITGRTTELTQTVESLQIAHRRVEHASRGTEVAMKVQGPVRGHDQVFRVRDG